MQPIPNPDAAWRLLDHTADIRLEVCGTTLEELFLNAASGLTSLLYSGPSLRGETAVDLSLDAGDAEELLVDWLREILYRFHTDGLVLTGVDLQLVLPTKLDARILFGAAEKQEDPGAEVKAVTYHGLFVEQSESGLCAKVLFDI